MSEYDQNGDERNKPWDRKTERQHQQGHLWTGGLLLLIGVVALMRSYLPDFPRWVFSWQMLLITLGIFIGLRHRFHGIAWLILIMIGGIFLANDYFLARDMRLHVWPIILIAAGLLFILRSRQKPCHVRWKENKNSQKPGETTYGAFGEESYSEDDFIDTTSIFGGDKKIILSKDFKGGDIVNIFGGTELNLTQADIKTTAILEVTTVFGGTKLIVPANWAVKSEAVTIFGGVDDKRQLFPGSETATKTLLIRGTVIFGGIDIKSF